jgi:hypothetical protein
MIVADQIMPLLVVIAPRKLMWASWLIQPGQSLTSRPEQNFACRAVTNCVKPKEWRIVGHNESEGMKLRNRKQLHWAKVSTSWKPVSLHASTGNAKYSSTTEVLCQYIQRDYVLEIYLKISCILPRIAILSLTVSRIESK